MGPQARRILRPAVAGTLLLAAIAGGCASVPRSAAAHAPTTGPTTLRLEQILPVPTLAAPASRPVAADEEASDEALLHFARARVERADGRRGAAVASLRQAAAVDPDSYEVRYALGKALRSGVGFDPAVVAEFERAVDLQPDRIDVQVDLARQYLAKGDSAEGLRRLRLAALTSQYAANDDRAAEVDLLLGHTLAELHYDRAAIDRLELLVARIDRGEVRWAEEEAAAVPRALPGDPPGNAVSGNAVSGDDETAAERPGGASSPEEVQGSGPRPASPGDPAATAREPRPIRRLPGGGGRSGSDGDGRPGSLVTRVHLQLGDLYIRRDRPADALAAYRQAEATPAGRDDPEVGGRLVLGLMAVGRIDDGLRLAADAVVWFRGSSAAVTVLRQAYKAVGRPEGAADALRATHRRRPDDSAVLFALCDVLSADAGGPEPGAPGKAVGVGGTNGSAPAAAPARPAARPPTQSAETERLLTAAWARPAGDPAILYRLVNLRLAEGDGTGAVRLMVEALADRPSLAGQFEPAWSAICAPDQCRVVTPQTVGRLPAPPTRQAARAYAGWVIASRWPRASLARRALDGAVAARPPFAPAFRAKLSELLADDARPRRDRLSAARALADAARAGGDPPLAAELEGRLALFADDPATAVAKLSEATAAPTPGAGDSPERRLAAVLASLATGDRSGFVATCRRLMNRYPAFDEAYATLHAHLASTGQWAEAERVLSAWERAWPAGTVNVAAALARAQDRLAADRPEAAELALAEWDQSDPAAGDLLTVLEAIADRTGRDEALAARLERCLSESDALGPAGEYQVAFRLARLHMRRGRTADAERALDRARAAAAGEPDRLYPLAALYSAIGEPAAAEGVLRDVVELDPSATAAGIDLALAWANQGTTNLDRAEALAKTAVVRDPTDPRALDALGWVLYKQGRAGPARESLERAIAAVEAAEDSSAEAGGTDRAGKPKVGRVDPCILDHLGDVLYRLGDRDGAGRAWDRCRQRLADEDVAHASRTDLRSLRLTLPRKLQQLRDGQDVRVSVAPAAAGVVPTP